MNNLKALNEEARKYYIGGGSAGGRYCAVLDQPLYIKKASGARIYDIEGKEYIDFYAGAGAALFGHNHPRLKSVIEKASEMGFFMNFDTEYHVELAKLIQTKFPCAERMRLCNTGTEATLGAIRIARSFTKKDIVIKFEGHFHGMHEMIWYNHNTVEKVDEYGEVETTPDSKGFPDVSGEVVKNVIFNDLYALEHAVKKYKDNLAAVIMEPVSFNCGCLVTRKEYLKKVREICDRENIVLIFDEVITGLRMRPGSAQQYFGVTPDITTIAKAIGGGFPISAIVGKEKIMKELNPEGRTVLSGTYSGALMPVLASIECFKMVSEPDFYDHIDNIADAFYGGVNDLFVKNGLPGHIRGIGARFGLYFGIEDPETDYDFRKTAEKFDRVMYKNFIKECLSNGLFFHDTAGPSSPAHYGFTSQHTLKDVEIALTKIDSIFQKIK